MFKQFKTYSQLIEAAAIKFISLSYSRSSVKKYCDVWRQIGDYMSAKDIQTYTPNVGLEFVSEKIGYEKQSTLSRSKRDLLRGVNALSDFSETGEIRKSKRRSAPITLEGPIGKVMASYILTQKKLLSLADSTVRSYYNYLSVFLSFLNVKKVQSLQELDNEVVLDFANNLTEYSSVTRHLIILKTNQFLKYLFIHKLLEANLSKVMVDKYTYRSKLPSYYSVEEISQLITAIDRSNPCGKRDYAILMLVSRMGLRSSDVVNLKFENLLWDKQLLSLIQTKTHQSLQLPLLPEVGNAIIDYLKDGRPESAHPYIFLRLIPPYDNLHTAAINGIIKKYLNRSGICYDERQHGPHSLRHSLATSLLNQEVSLPIISGVLGHGHMESTMNYLRVDLVSLKRCALEVPPLGDGHVMDRKGEAQ